MHSSDAAFRLRDTMIDPLGGCRPGPPPDPSLSIDQLPRGDQRPMSRPILQRAGRASPTEKTLAGHEAELGRGFAADSDLD